MKYGILLLFATLMSCTSTLPTSFVSVSDYDRSIKVYHNPVTKQRQYSVQLGASSAESLGWGPRFTCKMEVLKSGKDEPDYVMRFVLRSSAEEWPVADTAFMIIDDAVFPLALNKVHLHYSATHSGTEFGGSVSISTSDWQISRSEADDVEVAIDHIGQRSSVAIVFYSGSLPITFTLDAPNFSRLLALTRAKV